MLLKSILLVALHLVALEAARPEIGQTVAPSRQQHEYDKWASEVKKIFGPHYGVSLRVQGLIQKLQYIHRIETSANLYGLIDRFSYDAQTTAVRRYIYDSAAFVERTTILRKPQTLAQNLLEILRKSNGCSGREFSTFNKVLKLFGLRSKIGIALKIIRDQELHNCWGQFDVIFNSAINLMGQNQLVSAANLSLRIKHKPLEDFATNNYDADPDSIEHVSRDIASYIISLDHPELETTSLDNLAKIQSLLEEIYNIEVREPSARFCSLSNPIKRYFEGVKQLDISINPMMVTRISGFSILIKFYCNLGSFAFASIKSRIWEHFSKHKQLDLTLSSNVFNL